VDVLKDFVYLTYDPRTLTPEKILKVIRQLDFEGTVVPDRLPVENDN
jgi:hypothetical protein